MYHSFRRTLIPVAAMLALAASASTSQPAPKPDVRAEIARRLDVKVEDVKPSPVAGLYEILSGAQVGYVSEDGRFYVDGDVFDMTSKANLTEERRQEGRLELLAKVPDADAIIFSPTGKVRHTLTVFTDIDCTYCRQLHQQIAEFAQLGFRVRYLMYPRSGPDTESWQKAEAVWCSADRRDALTRAKRGEVVKSPRCEAPIAAQYALGHELNIPGTPAIFTDKGELLDPRILPAAPTMAASIASYLESSNRAAAGN